MLHLCKFSGGCSAKWPIHIAQALVGVGAGQRVAEHVLGVGEVLDDVGGSSTSSPGPAVWVSKLCVVTTTTAEEFGNFGTSLSILKKRILNWLTKVAR
jgi:hypothetical protein